MASFRIETISDPHTGMIVAQAFSGPADDIVATSGAIFHSHDQAEKEVREILQRAWPDRAPDAVDASIGV